MGGSIAVRWEPPSKGATAIAYKVYRKPEGEDSYKQITVPPLADAARTIPIDAGAGDLIVVERMGEPDGLALDDRASLVVVGGSERRVAVVGQGSPFLDVLIDIAPGFVSGDPAGADVLIVDGGPLPEIDRPTSSYTITTIVEGKIGESRKCRNTGDVM